MRRSILVILGAVLVAACADPVGPGSGTGPGPDPTRLDIYETVIRHLVGQEPIQWNEIVIVRGICADAGEASAHEACEGSFTAGDETSLLARVGNLADTVRFVDDPTPLFDEDWVQGEPDTVVLWLGPIEERGNEVRVGGSHVCGGLCGGGATWVLHERAGGWKVAGNTGGVWIS